MTINCYEVSFGDGEKVLNLDHGDNYQLCDILKTLNYILKIVEFLWYVNYISIKMFSKERSL